MKDDVMSEWQPIETAPMDWRNILLFSPYWEFSNDQGVMVGWFDADHECFMSRIGREPEQIFPTHWMPLPPPPKSP